MHVALTAVGADRPGIVAAVTKVLFEFGGNVEDSRMAILGGHFAMVLIVALPEGSDVGSLERALERPAGDLGLVVAVRPVADVSGAVGSGMPYEVRVYGADHPGIVARVSALLAERGVNIRDLATHVSGGDAPLYMMLLDVVVPDATDVGVLERGLRALGEEIGVDVAIERADPDTL